MGVKVFHDLDEGLAGVDVVMLLRLQKERMLGAFLPSLAEFHRDFGLTKARLATLKPDAIVMHPGPINRGVEIGGDVAYGPPPLRSEKRRVGQEGVSTWRHRGVADH